MKRCYFISILLCCFSFSCTKFLEEEPKGFIEASNYYTTPSQVKAAVAGTYSGLGNLMISRIGVSVSPLFAIEYMTGYGNRPYPPNSDDIQFLQLVKIDPANQHLTDWWNASFYPLENCNSVLFNLAKSTVIDEGTKKTYQGEVSFLRAWYYFQAVRLFGDIPLKTTPTTDLSNTQIKKSPVDSIYKQIVSDLVAAEQSGLPWTDKTGHVTLGAVKSLLAKVYITMAGFPLQKGTEYYQKAYDKANEVINSNQFVLFDNYRELRQHSRQNTGEHIFMLQRDPVSAPNLLHFGLMPYPYLPVSIKPTLGGALTTTREFYNSFGNQDTRKQEQQFFYTKYPEYNYPSNTVVFPAPYIFKYWDSTAEVSNRAGMNMPLIRYADILLICAESKTNIDGGSTADVAALNAYHQVRRRAFPAEAKPVSISTDEVLKERYWELCFEFQTWYDMLRTMKAFDVVNNSIVNLIGYKPPNHLVPFKESNLLFPIPLTEVQKNPNLR